MRFPLVVVLCLLLAATACKESTKTPNPNNPQPGKTTQGAQDFKAMPGQSTPIHFAHLEMNFKPVVSGDTVVAVYPFKNMSQETVRITQAVTSCNCLRTEFPQGNIQPGQLGEVKANFYTAGQAGRHEKIIAVVLDGYEETITLRLNGEILKQ